MTENKTNSNDINNKKNPKQNSCAFDHKGKIYPNLKIMCKTYNVYPEHYIEQIQSGVSKQKVLTGKNSASDKWRKVGIVVCIILSILLLIAIHHRIAVYLDISFFDTVKTQVQQEVIQDQSASTNLGFEKLHVDYSNLVTIISSDSASCSIENTSSADIRFSVECKLDTQDGGGISFAKNDTILKPGDKIEKLSIVSDTTIPTSKVAATFYLTLYEGASTTPLTHKVDIHSIVVSPS